MSLLGYFLNYYNKHSYAQQWTIMYNTPNFEQKPDLIQKTFLKTFQNTFRSVMPGTKKWVYTTTISN